MFESVGTYVAPPEAMSKLGLKVETVAELLEISESAVYDLIARRKIRAVKVNPGKGAIRIRPQDLEEFITSRLVDTVPA